LTIPEAKNRISKDRQADKNKDRMNPAVGATVM